MIISKTDEVRRELLAMTHEIAEQEEQNFRIAECIWGRLVVPHDQPDLQKAADGIAGILQIPAEKAMPLIVIARRIGIRDERLPGFLRRMERYLTVYRSDELQKNPYFSRIRAVRLEEGRFRFENTEFLDGELFFDKEPVKEGYARVNTLGIFDGSLSYPGFYEGDRCWMSITPNEIVTMQEPIGKASGKVLTLGLGLGYYAYMVHLKEDVTDVTVVEREKAVIDLFEKTLLPQFDHPEKIHIVQADAFSYMENLEDGEFDFLFADIWQNPLEGMTDYLHCKFIGNTFNKTQCDYWIEESFLGHLEQSMANVLQYEFLGEDDGEMASNPGYAAVKQLLRDTRVETADDVQKLFKGDFIKELVGRL